jgi:uncharacterized protein (DUF305 family)
MFLSRANLNRAGLLLLGASLGLTVSAVPAAKGDSHALTGDAAADANWSALSDSMTTMHRALAGVHPSEDADLNFVNLMLPHHQAAIDMAKVQLQYGSDPQMRRLAQEILTDQQSEIELMRLWLKQRSSASRPNQKIPIRKD